MQNPWNLIIPVLKVPITKVQGFFDLREVIFETFCHITHTSGKWWKSEVTKTRNPWNVIILVLKVSLTKVQGFFDLRECNFQTSFHIRGNEMMKIRGDRDAKSLKLYHTNIKSFSNKSWRIFLFERMQFSNLFSHKGQQNDEN